jgi:hypothetical protein
MNCTYNRTWVEIEDMLARAERKQNMHLLQIQDNTLSKAKKIKHMRNYKALEGVIKALKWTLGDKDVEHPLV